MARSVAQCGTRSGYNKHRRNNTEACAECKQANTDYYRSKYQEDVEYRNRVLGQMNTRNKERYLSDSTYREKEKARSKKNYQRRYVSLEFRTQLAENRKRWAKENLERRRELTRKHSRIRRALIANNERSPYTEEEVLSMYGIDCYICLLPIDLSAARRVGDKGWQNGLHIEHVIPIIKDGPDTLDNVRPSHGYCNISKGFK
jgi:hypothetical protein